MNKTSYVLITKIFLLIFFSSIYSQSHLVKEEIKGKKLICSFETNVNYKLTQENGLSIINFENGQNEFYEGDVQFPQQSIILSLPQKIEPSVKYQIVQEKNISAIPMFNKSVSLSKKGNVQYSEPEEFKNTRINYFEVKGYFWIEDNYCIHINVNPAIYNDKNNSVKILEEFKIELDFPNFISQSIKIERNDSEFIANSNFDLSISDNKYQISDDNWIDYTKNYIKLGVSNDGIYRIYKSDLENENINVSLIDPKTFQLFREGEEEVVFVNGEDDNIFDDEDYIEFFGIRNMGGKHRKVSLFDEPYNEYLGQYTDTTIYWLTWNGSEGKRIDVINKNINSLDTLKYYSHVEHYERNSWLDYSCESLVRAQMPNWSENQTWVGGTISVRSLNKSFTASDIYPDKSFKMFVKVQDYASNIQENAHLVSLSINSTNLWGDSVYIDKYEQTVLSEEFSTSTLKSGSNVIKINSIQTDATVNSLLFDWHEVEYPRYLITIDDSLDFSFSYLTNTATYNFNIECDSTKDFQLWKMGSSTKKFYANNNSGSISINDTISPNDKFILLSEEKIKSPTFYGAKKFLNLRDSENNADYLIITHKKFLENVELYKQFLTESYDLNVKTININDIYDEFSYGFFNPEAIKDFLMATHENWQSPKPKYVFLVGAATYDYYGNRYQNYAPLTYREINYVPSYGYPVSDSWFVIWDSSGANIPQMNIGRLPVKTNEQFEWYFEKHKNYLTQEFTEWNKKYLFFSGGDESNTTELAQLKSSNNYVIDNYTSQIPIGGKADHFYKTVNPNSNFGPYSNDYFENSIANGGVFISYIGHSGTQTWDNSIISPSQLKNDIDRYPIVSDFGCSTGKFAEPDVTSFSELFTLDSDGQALAYIGNSSLGFISTSLLMPKLFYKKILQEGIYNVGEAHKLAKTEMLSNYGSTGVYELFSLTNTLIGDPIISLPIPDEPNFVIKSEQINLLSDNLTDQSDTVRISSTILNLGKALTDSVEVLLLHTYNSDIDTNILSIEVPLYSSILEFSVSIKDKPGKHNLRIILDDQNSFNELSEYDNESDLDFYVASSKIRNMVNYEIENGFYNSLKFLNPIQESSTNNVLIEYSNNMTFTNKQSLNLQLDTIFSKFSLDNLQSNERYWFRTKRDDSDLYSSIFSGIVNKNDKFLLTDSISFSGANKKKLNFKDDRLFLDTNKINFKVLSAGFSDGSTVLVERDLVNYISMGTSRGHHVVVFDAKSFDFLIYKKFDVFGGDSTLINDYVTFLDSIYSDKLVAFAIKDEGQRNLSDELKIKIKEYGSSYIDSLQYRGSWAFLGKKGAPTGSMPEAFSHEGEGFVEIDTTIKVVNTIGNILTQKIESSSQWLSLSVRDTLPNKSNITYKPIGITNTEIEDTLDALNIIDDEASLSHIDAVKYPYMKILAEFEAGDNNTSPELYSLGVDYVGIPELAINYQVVSIEQDTVTQGEDVNLQFYVYNVGESTADSFKVKVESLSPNNSRDLVSEFIVDSLGSEQRKKYNISYNTTSFNGSRTFAISIDPENSVSELYEDNNYFNIPFYVKGDTTQPSLNLTIDGNEIFDGEYISSNPNIKLELNDPSLIPITDTSSIVMFLNNQQIYYSGNEDEVSVNFSESNPKVVVNYSPSLEDGEYRLRVFGKDASGNLSDSSGIQKTFNVVGEAKLLDVYNYPNPMKSETYFTFKLTQIPDEIKIKIFTIAGRLIKEIELDRNQLNFDLNKIYWDGLDTDGDRISNGVYLYKVIMTDDGKKSNVTQKLAVIR